MLNQYQPRVFTVISCIPYAIFEDSTRNSMSRKSLWISKRIGVPSYFCNTERFFCKRKCRLFLSIACICLVEDVKLVNSLLMFVSDTISILFEERDLICNIALSCFDGSISLFHFNIRINTCFIYSRFNAWEPCRFWNQIQQYSWY